MPANKRIDELERKVDALEARLERGDLALLTLRVTTHEVKSAGDGATASGRPRQRRLLNPPAVRRERERRSPVVNAKLTLPELENRPHLATSAETKFSPPVK